MNDKYIIDSPEDKAMWGALDEQIARNLQEFTATAYYPILVDMLDIVDVIGLNDNQKIAVKRLIKKKFYNTYAEGCQQLNQIASRVRNTFLDPESLSPDVYYGIGDTDRVEFRAYRMATVESPNDLEKI